MQLTKARNGPDGRGSCFLFETPLCVITLLTDEINIILQNANQYSGFQAGVNTPAILIIIIIIIPYGGINSRMTSYSKFPVLIDFPFQDAIFPFNRAAPLSHGC